MTLRTAQSDSDVRTRLTGFRVDLGTNYVTICVVSRLLCNSLRRAVNQCGCAEQ
jgi:hypothetical protein